MRVLGRVAAQCGENPHRLINQGSSALFISRGLAGPKFILNRNDRKGNALIFVCPSTIVVTAWASSTVPVGTAKRNNRLENRHGEKIEKT